MKILRTVIVLLALAGCTSNPLTGEKNMAFVDNSELFPSSFQQYGQFLREYHPVQSDEVNAWCMPGGKIVVYTGILPLTRTEAGLATVMGHEVSHALLNHGQQRMSAASGGSTPGAHPSDATGIAQLRGWTAEAKSRAAQFGVQF